MLFSLDQLSSHQKIFLIFVFSKLTLELYLSLRQKNYVWRNKNHVPEQFANQISKQEHLKAAKYTIEKGAFSRFSSFFETGVLLIWTLGGGLNALINLSKDVATSSLYQHLFLFLSFGLISLLLSLPLNIYQHFIIEEKYGFNKMTLKTFFIDTIKQISVGLILAIPALLIILIILDKLGDYWWLYAFLFMTLFQFFLIWIYPTWIAPLFNKFSPLNDGETKDRINALTEKIDFPHSGIFIMDASKRSSHGNAYFTGFGKNKRIVFFDNLLKSLTPAQVEAVLAHELGHMKLKHIIKGLIRSIVLSLITFKLMDMLINNSVFYNAHGLPLSSKAVGLLLFSIIASSYSFLLTPLNARQSRQYEFEADAFAHTHSSSKDLINALVKLYKENASTLTPDPVFAKYYYGHPPATERIRYLNSLN